MLQHVPEWLGHALADLRAGIEKVAIADPALAAFERLDLSSPAFADGGRMPDRFTADGLGRSPPLAWRDPPVGTARLAMLVEDADSPTPQPLVHAVLWDLPPTAGTLAEGAIAVPGDGDAGDTEVGRNSYLRHGWLPPDPPTGHGEHRYVFQLFALDDAAPEPSGTLGRSALLEAIGGHVLAAGVLIGTYSRAEPAGVGPVGTSTIAATPA